MFKEIKRLSLQSIVYGIGHFLVRGAQFIVIPIYTNYLNPAEYGAASVVISWIGCFNVIYLLGMDVAFLRFFIVEKEPGQKRLIFSTCFLLLLIVGSLFSVIISHFSPGFSELMFKSPNNALFVRYSAWILWLDALSTLPFLILRAEERAKMFVWLKLLGVIVNLIMNVIYIVFLKKGAEGIFLSFIWSSVISLILVTPYIRKTFLLTFNVNMLKEILNFGLPYILPGLSIWALDLIDRQQIEWYLGAEPTGIYSANYKFGMVMALFVAAFRFAWHPFFLSIREQSNAKQIYSRVLTYFVGLSGWFYLLMSFFVQDIAMIQWNGKYLLGKEYWSGLPTIPLIMLGYVFYGVHVNCIVSIYLTKKSIYLPLVTVPAALLNIIMNIVLIPRYGIMAAAFNTAVAYFVMAAAQYRLTQWIYPIPYELGRIVKLIVVIGILFLIGYWDWIEYQLLLKIVLVVAFPFLLKKFGFFKKEELGKFKEIWQKRKRFVEP